MVTKVSAKFIREIEVKDPDTGGVVEVELWKDSESGGIFGIDSSFLDQVRDEILSPFNQKTVLVLAHLGGQKEPPSS